MLTVREYVAALDCKKLQLDSISFIGMNNSTMVIVKRLEDNEITTATIHGELIKYDCANGYDEHGVFTRSIEIDFVVMKSIFKLSEYKGRYDLKVYITSNPRNHFSC